MKTFATIGLAIALLTLAPGSTSDTLMTPNLGEVAIRNGLSATAVDQCEGTVELEHAPVPTEKYGRFLIRTGALCTLEVVWQSAQPDLLRGDSTLDSIYFDLYSPTDLAYLHLEGQFSYDGQAGTCPAGVAAEALNGAAWRPGRLNYSAPVPTSLEFSSATQCGTAWTQWWTKDIDVTEFRATVSAKRVQGTNLNPHYTYLCTPTTAQDPNASCHARDADDLIPGEPGSTSTWGPETYVAHVPAGGMQARTTIGFAR